MANNAAPASDVAADQIIVVDDNTDLAECLALELTDAGFDVRTATDGRGALELIASDRPLCVLTDIKMPGMDGIELARRVRELYGSEIVIIAMTGMADDPVSQHPDVFDHCLGKPFEMTALRKILGP